ncbi:hypothetical protein EK21DRAFT_99254 [Setomelanomma holmii]|uniref:EthD domain-containing protein n=1 Tax=Setomelanomma holmii TaxID=210430 RepID=A0A9P4LM27_9PLEO|nr:hypothetical protein EK21DRAFT_99254 [Setomelanomma holmii]
MAKGVLWVSSRVTKPDKLTADKFCDWYENTHIQEVLSWPGLPSATLYEMRDIEYRHSDDFKALDGQTTPSKDLLNCVFKNARFDTRFYAEVQNFQGSGTKPLEPPAEVASDFDKWYREEHLVVLNDAPGFVRARRYQLVNGTALDEFEWSEPVVPKSLALHEFEGEVLAWKELQESAETEWTKRVMGGLIRSEIGWYVLKREYAEKEWSNVGLKQ